MVFSARINMFPYLYKSDSLIIGSYGVMLAIAYLVGRHIYVSRLDQVCKKKLSSETLIIALLVFGVIGAKLMFALKNPQRASLFDWQSLLSGSGFSSQGAILAAIIVSIIFARLSKVKLNLLLDSAAPAAVLAYAIARVGCFLSGDDCYGIPSDLPWAMAFPNGVAEVHHSVHPVPLYEMIYSFFIWLWLSRLQTTEQRPYYLFFYLLLTWGFCRFIVEFVSTNPPKLLAMSGSQIGALIMFIAGLVFFIQQKWFARAPVKKK